MKTFILIVSSIFPKYHNKKGLPTYFAKKILNSVNHTGYYAETNDELLINKIHTIRENFEYWNNIIKQVQNGNAILSIRQWLGQPYRKTDGIGQIEICKLDKNSGIGIQKIEFDKNLMAFKINDGDWNFENPKQIAINDGLTIDDFTEWFKNSDIKPMALIHFTNFRY